MSERNVIPTLLSIVVIFHLINPVVAVPTSRRCEIHGEILKRVRVPIIYGLVIDYVESQARTELFPHSNVRIYGGCIVEEREEAVAYYCYQCRVAEYRHRRAFAEYVRRNNRTPERGWWR
jgi:hypothetical protein